MAHKIDPTTLNDLSKEELIALIGTLLAEIQALKDQLAKNSQNSGKPPSSDGLKKPKPKSLREKGKRTSGGQQGHKGYTLEMVAEADEVVRHELRVCPSCAYDLSGESVRGLHKRQVFELPQPRLEITEHQVEVKGCPGCQRQVSSAFPAEVSQPTQYGERFKGLLVYMSTYQMLPLARIGQWMADCYGQPISDSTIVAALEQAAAAVAPSIAVIERGVVQAAVAHADETGLRVEGKLHWLHVMSTEDLTFYGLHAKRGQQALETFNLLPRFLGYLVHDGWRAYTAFSQCGHALCNAHLLRELVFLEEQHQQAWAKAMRELLLEIKASVTHHLLLGNTALDDLLQHTFLKRYHAILDTGFSANPPPPTTVGKRRVKDSPPRLLLKRMQHHPSAVLAFMRDFRVPFDNNLAERDLRMMKVKQKVSGCFRTLAGAQTFATLRSYLSTAHKHGCSLLQVLTDAFRGRPFIPALPSA